MTRSEKKALRAQLFILQETRKHEEIHILSKEIFLYYIIPHYISYLLIPYLRCKLIPFASYDSLFKPCFVHCSSYAIYYTERKVDNLRKLICRHSNKKAGCYSPAMDEGDKVAKALNDLCCARLNARDHEALSEFVQDYFCDCSTEDPPSKSMNKQ